ncbi:hypothetical protein LU11_gp304 [Pseudomonas phage Lu11]|uniref:hypothetical protein n=1 Tax=Pseudomonas phage Lu11 TaxID=1161927 RepID=UPI00025F185A|nr:hypothetical protein LU11_gp304 [Pseudomonas phage Lu11]AFH14835.1 hypothetical protein Lu11_0297 [Pseudomonas phage Lu11]
MTKTPKTLDTFLAEKGEVTKTPTKPKRSNGPRANATGDNHYASARENERDEWVKRFGVKANGLHRLQVALFKYLSDVDSGVVLNAIMKCRVAQQDSDFQDLWNLLDEHKTKNKES